ncbi:outer membrane protein assembly factor BamB family protein [Alienimonas californiensis]|uniref:Outer membrane protein assembly factor BamB n=1 Tax=Alienimonas californiensis TaxID=2527989 RepID=A0A517PCA8_9PLAN|nr:PQQ-binding-like beta-propeller repeat protein [Alienimonas californiensis]QDT16996.1 Outer membrane protein assembly factor BamB [Alienimonas californiensis]
MARLEITSPSGKVRETPLPDAAGLTVGRHASSDVRINADGVHQMHCRFLPDGDGYRVSAGPEGGLRVNGSVVTEKRLAEGDTMIVGPAKVTFRADRPPETMAESDELTLVAASSDALPVWADPARAKAAAADRQRRDARPVSPAPESNEKAAKPAAKRKSRRATTARGEADDNVVNAEAQTAIFEEVDEDDDPFDDGGDDPNPFAVEEENDADAADDDGLGALAALAADETGETPVAADGDEIPEPAAPVADPDSGEQPVLLPPGGRFAPLTKLAGPPARPGEQSIFKSPLVIGLTSVSAALTLAAFAFALLTAREQAQRLYDSATELRATGKYSAALETYDEFLREHPADALVPAVRRERGMTTIERAVDGSGGKWAEGVAAIETFVRENRDRDDFAESHPELASLSRRAALGAAKQAANGGPRELLATVEEAQTLHRRYADPEAASTTDQSREIAAALRTAEAAVVKRETFGDARATVNAALERNDFAAAHRAREDLIARYRDLANDRDVRRLKAQTLAAERDAVVTIPPADAPPPPPAPPAVLAPAIVSRASTGERSDGRVELVRAGSSLFAVDVVTAEPRWRAAVGGGGAAAFPPVDADAAGASVLICDAVRPALLSVRLENGAVDWRLPLPAPATGPPRSAGGLVLVGCADGSLLAVDPASGAIDGGLKFPQAVLSPPVEIGGRDDANAGRLLLAARRDVVYTLAGNPPAVEAVSYTGHGAGALAAPLQTIGRYVLICDNDRADSALLRAWAVDPEDGEATEVGRARVPGRIDVPPELRADVLFVSSSPERMTAYAVTDEVDKSVFSRLAAAQLPDPRPVPTYLAAGPDGALWAAGSALRKLELTGDGLQVTPAVLAVGRHVAPPQTNADRLFTTRLTPAGTATIFAAAEADAMVGLSRTVLAPALLAVTGGARPAALSATGVLTPLGDGFPSGGNDGANGDGGTIFLTNGRVLPDLDGEGRELLLARRLPDGGAAVGVGGENPRGWQIDPDGRVGRPIDLPVAPQLAPLPLGPGLLIAAAPRLELATGRGGPTVSAYTAPISGGEAPAWTALVGLSETKAAVTDAAGAIRLIQFNEGASPSLSQTAAISPEWFADLPPAVAGDALIVAGSDGRLHRLNGATLGETAAVDLPARAAFGPTAIGDRVLVALENGTVAGFAAADLTAATVTPLPEPAAGPPGTVGADAAAIVTAGGVAVRFDPMSGEATGRVDTGQPLVGAPFLVGDQPAAAAADGAVVRLDFAPIGAEVADRSEP